MHTSTTSRGAARRSVSESGDQPGGEKLKNGSQASAARFFALATTVLVLHTAVTVFEEALFSLPGFSLGFFLSVVTMTLMTCLFGFALALKQLLSGGRPVSQARAELRRLASTRSAYRGLAIVFSTYTLSTTLSKVSLAYISVPLQVVIKSGKLVPVMLGGRFITGRVYSRSEYAGAVLLVAGIALFSTAGGNVSTAAGHLSADAALSIGVGLLLLTLCADALLGNWQERTMHAADISPSQMMALQCSFAALLSGLAAVVTGELAMGIQLVHSSPQRGYICQQLLMYALVLLLGTIAVLTLVDEHGAAAAVLVTLVRKCSSMAFSYILYPKELGARHVLGALMVFASPYVAKRGGKAKVKALAPAEAQGDAQA